VADSERDAGGLVLSAGRDAVGGRGCARGRAPALITDAPLPGRMQGSEARESIERRAASENALRATTINDFAELERRDADRIRSGNVCHA